MALRRGPPPRRAVAPRLRRADGHRRRGDGARQRRARPARCRCGCWDRCRSRWSRPTSPVSTSSPPVAVTIPAIGVTSILEGLRLNARQLAAGAAATPTAVGWYSDGPAPGDRGAAVLAGHLDFRTGPAVFWRLAALRAGGPDPGAPRRREDADLRRRPQHRLPAHATSPRQNVFGAAGAELHLITCNGTWDRRSVATTTASWCSPGSPTVTRAAAPTRHRPRTRARCEHSVLAFDPADRHRPRAGRGVRLRRGPVARAHHSGGSAAGRRSRRDAEPGGRPTPPGRDRQGSVRSCAASLRTGACGPTWAAPTCRRRGSPPTRRTTPRPTAP